MKESEYFFIGEISDGENAVNSVNTFFINGKSIFSNGPRRLSIT